MFKLVMFSKTIFPRISKKILSIPPRLIDGMFPVVFCTLCIYFSNIVSVGNA